MPSKYKPTMHDPTIDRSALRSRHIDQSGQYQNERKTWEESDWHDLTPQHEKKSLYKADFLLVDMGLGLRDSDNEFLKPVRAWPTPGAWTDI